MYFSLRAIFLIEKLHETIFNYHLEYRRSDLTKFTHVILASGD